MFLFDRHGCKRKIVIFCGFSDKNRGRVREYSVVKNFATKGCCFFFTLFVFR